MTVKELAENCNLRILSGKASLESEITGGYASDLLSDVMGSADSGQVWITLQTHKNVIAVASLKELAAVILVKNNQPDADALQQSEEDQMPVLLTEKPAFEIIGEIYQALQASENNI